MRLRDTAERAHAHLMGHDALPHVRPGPYPCANGKVESAGRNTADITEKGKITGYDVGVARRIWVMFPGAIQPFG